MFAGYILLMRAVIGGDHMAPTAKNKTPSTPISSRIDTAMLVPAIENSIDLRG
jgi:hypothetical protein